MAKKKRSKHSFPVRYRRGFLKNLDQRTAVAKALNSMRDAIVADLGGSDQLSVLQYVLVEEVVWTHYRLRELRRRMAEGEDVDGVYGQLVNTFAGLAGKLGLKRSSKNLSLSDYAAQLQTEGKP